MKSESTCAPGIFGRIFFFNTLSPLLVHKSSRIAVRNEIIERCETTEGRKETLNQRKCEREKAEYMRKESSEMYIGTIILHDKTLKIEF